MVRSPDEIVKEVSLVNVRNGKTWSYLGKRQKGKVSGRKGKEGQENRKSDQISPLWKILERLTGLSATWSIAKGQKQPDSWLVEWITWLIRGAMIRRFAMPMPDKMCCKVVFISLNNFFRAFNPSLCRTKVSWATKFEKTWIRLCSCKRSSHSIFCWSPAMAGVSLKNSVSFPWSSNAPRPSPGPAWEPITQSPVADGHRSSSQVALFLGNKLFHECFYPIFL